MTCFGGEVSEFSSERGQKSKSHVLVHPPGARTKTLVKTAAGPVDQERDRRHSEA